MNEGCHRSSQASHTHASQRPGDQPCGTSATITATDQPPRGRSRAQARARRARPDPRSASRGSRSRGNAASAARRADQDNVVGERGHPAWDWPSRTFGRFRVVRRVRPSPDVPVPLLQPSLLWKHSSMRPVISRTSARPSNDLGVGRGKRPAAAPRQQPQRAQPLTSRASQPAGRRLITRGTGAMMSVQVDIGSTCQCSFTDSRGEDGRRTEGLYVVEGCRLPSIYGDRGLATVGSGRWGSRQWGGGQRTVSWLWRCRSFAAVSDGHGSAECWGLGL